jgi:hypothetical protein
MSKDGHALCPYDLIRPVETSGVGMSERSYGKHVSQVIRVRGYSPIELAQTGEAVVALVTPADKNSIEQHSVNQTANLRRAFNLDRLEASPQPDAGNSPVFDLLESSFRVASEASASKSGSSATGHKDASIIHVLYERYCESLVSPLAVSTINWANPGEANCDNTSAPETMDTPIASILGDIHTMEQAFGMLERSDALEVRETVPEILSLFAPPEHRAAAARRAEATPPELARREHHAVSLDSPMGSIFR